MKTYCEAHRNIKSTVKHCAPFCNRNAFQCQASHEVLYPVMIIGEFR